MPERDETLLPTPLLGVQALRCAALYGSNAAGKSNILQAMTRFSGIVDRSQRSWNPTGSIPSWEPFALDDFSQEGETLFEIDFSIDSKVYVYGFKFNQTSFTEEWLLDQSGARAKTLFRRKTTGTSVVINFSGKNLGSSGEDLKLLNLARLQTRPNSLFLSSAAQSNVQAISDIFKWIAERFNILKPVETDLRYFTAERFSSPEQKMYVNELMMAADVGIVDYEVSEVEMPESSKKFITALMAVMKELGPGVETVEESKLPLRHDIKMTHKGEGGKLYPLDFSEESSGTRAYFRMLGPILDELRRGGMLLLDELESSLHPLLAKLIVSMFNDPELNPRGAQLIFSTHSTELLDLTLLRRDQIWFVEKSDTGATALISLSSYKQRKGQDVASAYLNGRFGAVPLINADLARSGVMRAYLDVSTGDDSTEKVKGR